MSTQPAPRVVVAGDLRAPTTTEGAALLERIIELVPRITDGAAERDEKSTFPVETFEHFRTSGVLGATVPAELGGLGVTRLYDVALALMTVAEADAATALALHVQFSRGLTLTWEWQHGAPQASRLAVRLLRLMATGTAAVCGAVKDHHSAVTELRADGSGGWVLSGRKTLVSMAPIATHFVVYAQRQADGEVMLAAPVLSRDTPGLSVVDSWDGLGMRASGTADVVFDDCPVADSDIMPRGPVGTRSDAPLAGHTVSSITMLGIYAGVAKAARDVAVTAVRRRASAPLAATRTLLADIDTRLYGLRAVIGAALANADTLSPDMSGDLDERGRRMMTPFQYAKMSANETAPAIVNDCLTLVGGAAFSSAHPLARLYRDVRAGGFMQPYAYVDGVEFLSAQALEQDRDNNYISMRVARDAA